jgi:hypothetical protein
MPQADGRTEWMKDLAEGSVPFSSSRPSEFQHGQQQSFQTTSASTSVNGVPLKRQAPPEFQQGQPATPKTTCKMRLSGSSEPSNCQAPSESLQRRPATQQGTWATKLLNEPTLSEALQAQPKSLQISSNETPTVASAPRVRQKSPDCQQGQPMAPIHINDEEESLARAKSPAPMFAITTEFMVAYAGPHTLQLESQHRS